MKISCPCGAALAVTLIGFLLMAIRDYGVAELPASAEGSSAALGDCDGCQSLKVIVSDDPHEQPIQFERFEQSQTARHAQVAAETRARALEWKGARFAPIANADDGEKYLRQKEAADRLSAHVTVPESRVEFFRAFLTSGGVRHVGWEGSVADVSQSQDASLVELHVRPSLATVNGSAAFTSRWMREIWRIDRAGRVSLQTSEPGGGVGAIIVD